MDSVICPLPGSNHFLFRIWTQVRTQKPSICQLSFLGGGFHLDKKMWGSVGVSLLQRWHLGRVQLVLHSVLMCKEKWGSEHSGHTGSSAEVLLLFTSEGICNGIRKITVKTYLAFSWPLLLFMIRLSPDLLLMFSDYFCGCCLAIFRVADKRACVWIIVAMLSYTDGVWMLLFRSTSCDHSHCFRPHCFCFLIPVAFSCTLSLMQLFCLVM